MSITRGIVGCWSPSLGATGLMLRDLGPYRNHGAFEGGLAADDWIATEQGLGIRVANTGTEGVNCGNLGSLAFDVPFTAACWMRDNTETTDRALFGKLNGSTNYPGWLIFVDGSVIKAYWNNSIRATGTTSVIGQPWQLCAITWTGTRAQIHINGRLDADSATTTAPAAGGQIWAIGKYFWPTNRSINGTVGEACAWYRPLSDSEHLELYRRGNGWLGRELTGMNQRRTYGKKLGNRRRRLLCGGMT